MKFSNKILSQTITQLCLSSEINHVVISPGSRNAPLTIGFTLHPSFKNYSIVDERCAAFFALGLAQQLKKPVVLVCTSGSALLNYYPAIAEAYYSDIPLVIISADRPSELIEIGDGQTIKQENVFENHILYSANCKEGEEFYASNEKIISEALHTAIKEQGPVHINAPFAEPLYQTVDELSCNPKLHSFVATSKVLDEDIDSLTELWNKAEKKIILVGVLAPNSIEQRFIEALAKDESLIVLTETTSNLHHDDFFPAIDQLIAPLTKYSLERLRPDLLVTMGGMIVSKKIKAFLRSFAPTEHWHVNSKKAYDTFFKLTRHIKLDPNTFLTRFIPKTDKVFSTYRSEWQEIRNHRIIRHFKYEKQIEFSDFLVFSIIFKSLPKQIKLQLSNSTTIRYSQLFSIDPTVEVYCNRGTSGIDGSMSTAIGAASVSKLPTIFLSGDLSFFYDSNALWNKYIPDTFRIIVINNGGGGIFRILPGAKEAEHFKEFFETEHSLSARQLCEMYQIDYISVKDQGSMKKELEDFYGASERPRLLEVFTPSEVNEAVLFEYFQYIK